MALIVAGRFSTFEQANEAASQLHSHQIDAADVSVFYLNPPGQHDKFPIGGDQYADPGAQPGGKGAWLGVLLGAIVGVIIGGIVYLAAWRYWLMPVLGVLIGAYLGSLVGAMKKVRGRRTPASDQSDARDAGVMIAARVDNEETAGVVTQVLQDRGAENVERANGVWKDGQWQDFDPLVPPNAGGTSPRM